MDKKFDFSEIDEALPAAEKMQEKERTADALENNYEAVRFLNANVEKLENRLSEALAKVGEAVSSLRAASTVTVSKESRQALEREGEEICRKIARRTENEATRLLDRLSMKDRIVISSTAFWCVIEVTIFLAAAFVCTCMANSQFIHSPLLWKTLGCMAVSLTVCIILTVFTCRKLKQ